MMAYLVDVWVNLAGQQVKAGEFVCEINSSNGKGRGAFRYSDDYLGHVAAYAFDPVSLPLGKNSITVDHPGVFSAFLDSLPDDWGKRLLIRKHNLPRGRQNFPEMLMALGASGLGALSYAASKKPVPPAPESSILTLDRLVYEAELFESGATNDADIAHLLSAGSSPGGARPKALVHDPDQGRHYLAKFPSSKDTVDVVRIEAATMSLATRAGLVVPPTSLIQCGGKPVLLVERFDVTATGRRHMISMQTLLKAEGYYQCRYKELLDMVRMVSADPGTDSSLLFRQMVFNAVIGNTDDHLKNFWMTCAPREGWRLSPAFDLLPDIREAREHTLFFDLGGYHPGRKLLEKLGRSWGVSKSVDIVEEVYAALQQWRNLFADFDVSDADCQRFREIDQNLR
ncbi:MAG: type II toxin-antitoxin system HipA family toxin [Geobacter sp.]|nr:type II toxin-antitoxin system HipA family toxin [Geobacter sp.]